MIELCNNIKVIYFKNFLSKFKISKNIPKIKNKQIKK